MKVSGWGRFPVIDAEVQSFRTTTELHRLLQQQGSCIGRGLGRSYGDSALAPRIISTSHFNRILAFDEARGIVECQAGVSIADLLHIFTPRGWFPPVVPGTKFVTIGGAIAADIHGKNHHKSGSFARHILHIDVALSNGETLRCSALQNSELFYATCGGMGLTGIILSAAIRLQPIETVYIRQETLRADNLEDIDTLFQESATWTYSVAWLDCLARGRNLGRSILYRGEHALVQDLHTAGINSAPLSIPRSSKLTVPFDFPNFALNRLSVKLFNTLYFHKAPAKPRQAVVSYEPFFFPLDTIHSWNRIYGKRGFTQYQCVVPGSASREGIRTIILEISNSGESPFLCVLKLFGPQQGCLSFPTEGYTLAVDFPITKTLPAFLNKLDDLLEEMGGRVYLCKDARLRAKSFRQSYPNSTQFLQQKHRFDAAGKFKSLQSSRLGL